jgi:hypothetical protein
VINISECSCKLRFLFMSVLLKSCLDELKSISNCPHRKLNDILSGISNKSIKAISEISLNVFRQTIPIVHTKKENDLLRILSRKSISLKKKRSLILKSSKFIKLVIKKTLKYLHNGGANGFNT